MYSARKMCFLTHPPTTMGISSRNVNSKFPIRCKLQAKQAHPKTIVKKPQNHLQYSNTITKKKTHAKI